MKNFFSFIDWLCACVTGRQQAAVEQASWEQLMIELQGHGASIRFDHDRAEHF